MRKCADNFQEILVRMGYIAPQFEFFEEKEVPQHWVHNDNEEVEVD